MSYIKLIVFLVLSVTSLNMVVESKEREGNDIAVIIYAYLPNELNNEVYSHMFPKPVTVVKADKIKGYSLNSACQLKLLEIKTDKAKKKLGKGLLNNFILYVEAKDGGQLDKFSDYHKAMIEEGAVNSMEALKNLDKIKYNYECQEITSPEDIFDIRL
ncbi:MAG: hypothetical protein HUJ16_04720 [Kangiella sp.]|nr:hypothetical protein [Kangiella sp.]